jgi:hypothetical protein
LIDPKLKDYAAPAQARYIDAVIEHGSATKAAAALGIDKSMIHRGIAAVKAKAAQMGYAPDHDMTRAVPDGFKVKGVSTYYDSEGVARGQWVKSTADDERREEMLREFVGWLVADATGKSTYVAPPVWADADLLAVIPMGDPHFGLYAWAKETGDDFDLAIAERLTCAAVDRLVSSAPDAETGLLLNLGDYFHADNSSNRTPQSGHALDVDTRFGLVAQVGLRAMVHCINQMLGKFKRVIVWNMPGNHDPHSAFMLALCLDAFFQNNPRVEVDLSPSCYRYLRHGKVLIGSHHGDGAKSGDLPLLMAADRPEDWGETKFRHWLVGHIHHWTAKEHPGVIVETFRTLAGKDAWHAGKGYRSGRDMQLLIFHREFGEVERHRCDIAMLEAA